MVITYRSSIESEKLLVQRDIQKLVDFSKAYKSFLENDERIDKQYAKIISNAGYDYRNETGLIKEEWKKAGKLIIGTLIIAGTVAAAVFILEPILIGAAVGACVSAAIGAGTGYLTGGAEGAIDGFFYGSISGAITGAIGGLVAGPPPALGSAPKEVLKYMAKQSIADGVGEGLAGGTVGYMKGGTEGAVAGGVSGLVSGTVTGLISGGISYKAQGLPQKIINKFKDGKLDGDINIDTKGVSKAEINTAESIKNIINENGYSADEFARLLHPDRVLTDSEKILVDSIRKEIGLPSADTLMCKTIPQSDIYKYLYNEYDGVRGFTAVGEHGANLNTLLDKYNGARLDYNNTAFKTTTGIDGISQSVGLPDKFYGTIEYKVNDVSKISIPDWAPKPDDYPYTGKAFTGSTDVVLPEYFQDTRKFMNGDVFNVIDSDSGKIISKFKYDIKFGWVDFN